MSLETSPTHAGVGHNGGPALEEWATIEKLVADSDGLITESQVRWALRYRNENGLAEHVTRFGRRLYLHVPGFARWFKSLGGED